MSIITEDQKLRNMASGVLPKKFPRNQFGKLPINTKSQTGS